MAYRIEYSSVGKLPKAQNRKWTGVVAGVLILTLVAGALAVKTIGLSWVREVLIPGDPDITAAALEGVAEDLRSGVPLHEAIKAFCKEIVENAAVSE